MTTSMIARPRGARSALVLLLALVALAIARDARAQAASPSASSSAPESAKEKALKLHDEARDLYDRGEYRKAIQKLEQAAALDPTGKELVYNLGLIHEKLGDVDEAARYYEKYLDMETDLELRERAENARRRLAGARKDLAPKVIVVQKEAPKRPPPIQPPVEVRRPLAPMVVVSAAVAVSAFVASGVFAVAASEKNPGSDATTGNGVSADDLADRARAAHREAIVADVGLAVGGVAAATALVLYLTTPPRPVRASLAAQRSWFGRAALQRGVAVRF